MQSTRVFATSRITCRFISLSSIREKSNAGRESKFLIKLMSRGTPKRKWFKDNPKPSINDCGIDVQKKRITSLHVHRRMTVLNKLFMAHITDLMSTGDTEITERGIEVTRVSLTPDFNIANVFWTHEKINDEDWVKTTNEMLKRCAFTLRHELSQLRVISHVPPIHFVKDKTYAFAKEIEERLATADFGPDYKRSLFTLEQTVHICSPSDIDDITSKSDINCNKSLENNDFQITLPQMKQDVLGLDHYSIMSKIKSSLAKTKCTNKESSQYPTSTSTSTNIDNFMDNKQQELFTQFLKKRQIQEKHRRQQKCSKRMEHNPLCTNEETLDYDEDEDISYDTLEYYENIYEDEIDNEDKLNKDEFQ